MARGVRRLPLKEPEPEVIEATDYISDLSISAGEPRIQRRNDGTLMPGSVLNPTGRRPPQSVTEALRQLVDQKVLALTLWRLAVGIVNVDDSGRIEVVKGPDLNAVTYIYDRLDGRPRQSLGVSTSDDDPILVEARKQAAAWTLMAEIASGRSLEVTGARDTIDVAAESSTLTEALTSEVTGDTGIP